jgi:hypothetical protein
MINRFRAADRKNLDTFQGIIEIAGRYVPLNFLFNIYNHMKKNPEGFNDEWLLNALHTTKELSSIHSLSEGTKSLMYAVTLLMESGRCYEGPHPHDASAAFAVVFLNEHAEGFFTDDEIKTVFNCCRRSSVMNMRPSIDTAIALIAHQVRLLTDVFYPNPSKLVIDFVKNNSTPNLTSMSPEEWCQELAEHFARKYGRSGTVWRSLPIMVLNNKQEKLRSFQAIADDRRVISDLVKNNYNRIFARR